MCELLEILEVINPIKSILTTGSKYMDLNILSYNILHVLSLGAALLGFICKRSNCCLRDFTARNKLLREENWNFYVFIILWPNRGKSMHFQNGTTCLLTTGLGLDWLTIQHHINLSNEACLPLRGLSRQPIRFHHCKSWIIINLFWKYLILLVLTSVFFY